MQTFLPYADFDKSARCLDPSRLGNQVYREGKTLIKGGWPNHPASRMWRGYRRALAEYCLACLRELERRGRKYPHHVKFFKKIRGRGPVKLPPWVGSRKFHASHRSNLLRKDFAHYSSFGWAEPNDLPYVWPTNETTTNRK